MDKQNRRFNRVIAALVGLSSLCALTVPLASAQAQVYFGFGSRGFDVGVAAPYYYAPYYTPYYAPYYYRPYYRYW